MSLFTLAGHVPCYIAFGVFCLIIAAAGVRDWRNRGRS